MSKEGLLNEAQRGVLKDLILDYDQRLLQCLQEYETGGDREKLYFNFLQQANFPRGGGGGPYSVPSGANNNNTRV